MAYYPLPGANDTMGFFEIFRYVNNIATDGLFFFIMSLVIWVTAFMVTKQYSSSRAFTFASFFCAVLMIILAVFNLINPKFMYVYIILVAVGFAWLKIGK